jgi:hypothetical protein
MIQVLCNHFHDVGQRATWGKVAVWNRTLQLQNIILPGTKISN